MKLPRISKLFLPVLLILILVGLAVFSLAQTPQEERQALEKELQDLEKQISQYENDITQTQQQKKTFQNQISVLKKKIQQLDLQIKQSNAMIKDISYQIVDTESSIDKTSLKIDETKSNLADILKVIYQEDQKSLVEVMVASAQISDFFSDVEALENLNTKSRDLLSTIRDLKVNLETQKDSLDSEKEDLQKVAQIQALQRATSLNTKSEQEKLLEQTKGKESEYQKLLSATQKRAAEIRARIFELIGVAKAPTFEEAYNIAKYVSSVTGVRTAFLLAVLTQESNIGKNVGQCYVTNFTTGAGTSLNGSPKIRVMSPKTVPAFVNLASSLGMTPEKTPVSCWIPLYSRGVPYGWGGAMGPAQFIISTWNLYTNKISQITGKTASPWNINDAFLGAGLLLRDNGALQNEFRAAMKYFSGGSWTRSEEFYGNSVLSIAAQYEKDIAAIQ